MKDYNKISICNLLWLAEYQCKGVFQPKILVLTINFFSLNLISREIEGDRASFSQNKRTLQGRGGAQKRTRANKGRGGQNSGILSEHTFWMPPLYFNRDSIFYFIYVYSYWRIISNCFILSWISDTEMIHQVLQFLH